MKEYNNALVFWDSFFKSVTPSKIESMDLGSSTFDNIVDKFIKEKESILDFGCGSGWASFVFGFKNAHVTGVDQSVHAIAYASEVAKLSNLSNISFEVGNDDYCENKENEFDGVFSCNLLDVIPIEIARKFIRGFYKALKQDGEMIMMVNPYLDKNWAKEIKMEEIAPNTYAKDGNLRCFNLSNDEWIEEFTRDKMFTIDSFVELNFAGENTAHKRRLFYLKKN